MFVINCKNYEEISGDKIIKFVKTAEKVSKKFKVKIAIAPPQHLLGVVSDSSIPVPSHFLIVSKIVCRPTAVVASAAGRKYNGNISAPITP